MLSTGAKQTSVCSMISHHSSRVLVLKISRDALLERRPLAPVHLVGQVAVGAEAGQLEQLGVELRLDRSDRDVLAVARLVDVVEVGAGVEQVRASLVVPDAHGPEGVEHGHQHRGAVDHGRVDDLALAGALGFEQGAHDAEGQEHAAAAEVADQVERRNGRLAATADGVERAGEGDVVDVVAGGLGVGAVLAPAGHAAVDELGVAGQAVIRADAEALGHAGAEALDEHVGLLDHGEHRLDALRALEVDADRAAAAVQDVGGRRLGVAAHAPGRRGRRG